MKKLYLFFLAAALLSASSCVKDESVLFRLATMGFIQEDRSFKGDDGGTYLFSNTGNSRNEALVTAGTRLYAVLDALSEEGTNRYRAKLLDFNVPLYKEIVKLSDYPEPSVLGSDPLYLGDWWYSGGCLNMIAAVKLTPDSDKKHIINLLLDDTAPIEEEGLIFTILHDAQGDVMADGEDITGEMITQRFLASFPLESLLPEGLEEVKATMNWLQDGDTQTESKALKIE